MCFTTYFLEFVQIRHPKCYRYDFDVNRIDFDFGFRSISHSQPVTTPENLVRKGQMSIIWKTR